MAYHKIYTEAQWVKLKPHNRAVYSESYIVQYSAITAGITTRAEVRYYTSSKSAGKGIRARFKADYPGAKVIKVYYE